MVCFIIICNKWSSVSRGVTQSKVWTLLCRWCGIGFGLIKVAQLLQQQWSDSRIGLVEATSASGRYPSSCVNLVGNCSDTLILDFEEHYVDELTEKSNFMNLTKRVLCPQLLEGVNLGEHYQALPPSIYNCIPANLKPRTCHHWNS